MTRQKPSNLRVRLGSLKKYCDSEALVCSYRCVAVNAAHTVEIDGGQTLVRQAVVKAASWAIASFLVCVVQRHLKHEHVRKISIRNTKYGKLERFTSH